MEGQVKQVFYLTTLYLLVIIPIRINRFYSKSTADFSSRALILLKANLSIILHLSISATSKQEWWDLVQFQLQQNGG